MPQLKLKLKKKRTKAQLVVIGHHSQCSKRRNYKQHRCDRHFFKQSALILDSLHSRPWDQGCRARRDRSQERCQQGVSASYGPPPSKPPGFPTTSRVHRAPSGCLNAGEGRKAFKSTEVYFVSRSCPILSCMK